MRLVLRACFLFPPFFFRADSIVFVVTIAGHELWLQFKAARAWPRCGSWDVAGRLDTFAIRSAEGMRMGGLRALKHNYSRLSASYWWSKKYPALKFAVNSRDVEIPWPNVDSPHSPWPVLCDHSEAAGRRTSWMLWAERQVPWALPFMLQCSRSSLGGVWGRMSVQELGDELERNLQDSSGSDEFLNFSRNLVTVAQCKNCFPLNVAVLSAAVSSCSPPPTTSQQTLSQGSMALTQGDSSARSLLCSLCLLWV